jgi:alkanesulfonate monooxygenase SsuD/methylene tetrahydromethanopterin reductase-like flavin-dependent oxidoreductase (luciferase family)
VTYRNPAFLAKVVTTLDIVSSGRAILGIGAAWNDAESDAYGYDFPRTAERFDRLEDALEICRSMFTQTQSTVHGKVARVDGAWNVPQPVQPGGPKILIGGGGERKTLRLTARYADLWNGFGDPPTVRHKLEVLREHCEAVGRNPKEIVTTRLGTLIVAETMADAERRKRAWQEERGIPDESVGARLWWGDPDAIRREEGDARRGSRRPPVQHARGVIRRGRPARRRGPRAAPLIEPDAPGTELSPATELRGARSVVPQEPGFARLPWRACGPPRL